MLLTQKLQDVQDPQNDLPSSYYRDSTVSLRALDFGTDIIDVFSTKEAPHILLVDDDPMYGAIMKRVAKSNRIQLSYVHNIEALSLNDLECDVLVIDYDLGAITGFEVTKYIDNMTMKPIPVILVSQADRGDALSWPINIREFVHKKLGPYAVLDAAFEAFEIHKNF